LSLIVLDCTFFGHFLTQLVFLCWGSVALFVLPCFFFLNFDALFGLSDPSLEFFQFNRIKINFLFTTVATLCSRGSIFRDNHNFCVTFSITDTVLNAGQLSKRGLFKGFHVLLAEGWGACCGGQKALSATWRCAGKAGWRHTRPGTPGRGAPGR